MIIKRNKIILATRYEMYGVYLDRELYDIYDFNTFLKYCRINGTRIEETIFDKIRYYVMRIINFLIKYRLKCFVISKINIKFVP